VENSEPKPTIGDSLEDRFELGPTETVTGASEVIAARDRQLGRGVAVKRATLEASEPDLRRILVEAQIAAQLEHAHVVPLYSMETSRDGQPAFTMKRVRGETLARYVDRCIEAGDPREGPYSLTRRLEHFLDACDAVAHAHARSVYHRNLALETISLGGFGEVYVTDWGYARRGDGGPIELTVSPVSVPGSLSPVITPVSDDMREKARDEAAESKDRHALAMVLSELISLSPRRPADPAARPTLRRKHRRVPAPLAAILRGAVVEERYPDVRALADDVRRHLRGEAPSVRPDPPSVRFQKRIARRPAPYLLGLLGVVVAIGGGTIAGRIRSLEAEAQEAQRSQQLTELTSTLSDRADHLDGLLDETASELVGLRATLEALPPAAFDAQADGHLAALARRTNALRAYAIRDGVVHAVGPAAIDLARRAPGVGLTWGDPLRRGAQEPWVLPLSLSLRAPNGSVEGLVGLDMPLALLTHTTHLRDSPRAHAIRLVDHQGRRLDAQGPMPGAIDPELIAHIDAAVETEVMMNGPLALALARVHALGWYVIGERDVP